jgi:hypothetical protein
MLKLLISLFAVLVLWTGTAPAQDPSPEKPKTDDSQPAEQKPAAQPGDVKTDESKPADKSAPADAEKAKDDDSKPEKKHRRTPARAALKATPTPPPPVETPAPKRGFLSGIFHSHPKATPKPAATPVASPTPKAKLRRRNEKRSESESPGESSSEGKKPDEEKKSESEKKPESEKKSERDKKKSEKPDVEKKGSDEKKPDGDKKAGEGTSPVKKEDATTPAPTKARGPGRQKVKSTPAPETTGPVDPETAEKNRFESVKARALEDPQIQEIKAKADSAATEEEGKKALRAYWKALFNKMRRLDPSLKEHIDIMESVIDKHLDE